MIPPQGLFPKSWQSRLALACAVTLSASVTFVALANPDSSQDRDSSGNDNTTSTGTRGSCESNNQGRLTILAPIKQVGKTTSLHPTFAWFVPENKSFDMEFQLFELDGNNQPGEVKKLELKSSPGIMKVSLPENQPGLSVGKTYLWQVVLLCNPNFPSNSVVAKAKIQVIEMPPALRNAVSNTKETAQIVELYAEAGLWYDALGEALKAGGGSRLGQIGSNLLDRLAREEPQQSETLRQIASNQQ